MADINTTADVQPRAADAQANPDGALFQTDANQVASADAVEVLRRALADAEARKAHVASPAEVKASDTPTGELPATVEEAQAMADYVATPKRSSIEDLQAFRATTATGREYFEKMLIHSGDVVAVTQDVYDADDLTTKLTLVQGDTVPDSKVGFVPANYISDALRLRIIGK